MTSDPPVPVSLPVPAGAFGPIPALFAAAGEAGARRLVEWLTADIRNPRTRESYARAVARFSAWCETHGLRLAQLTPIHAAAYVESLAAVLEKPTVKQHLAALRVLGDYLVTGQIIPANPFGPVRGPRYVVKTGKTPVLTAEEMRQLFAAIDPATLAGKRDAALIAVMAYSFARISAVLAMDIGDYRQQGRRSWLALHEKGGKEHAVPCHHKIEAFLDDYLAAAGIAGQRHGPLFRTLDRHGRLTIARLDRREALAMVKRRSKAAGLGDRVCCHSFRATGITVFLQNGGSIETAQALAAHESPRTTKLYDRTQDEIGLAEVERIRF